MTTDVPDLALARLCEGVGLAAVLEPFCAEAQYRLPAVGVSVTLRDGGGLVTAASSRPLAARLDELQYSLGEGPCVLAATGLRAVDAPDLRLSTAWPQWTPAALAAGVESVHAIALLSVQSRGQAGYLGALNVYGATPDAFAGPVLQLELRVLGQLAAITLENARLVSGALLESGQLHMALAGAAPDDHVARWAIARADVNTNTPLSLLVNFGRWGDRKLRDVANAAVHSQQGILSRRAPGPPQW